MTEPIKLNIKKDQIWHPNNIEPKSKIAPFASLMLIVNDIVKDLSVYVIPKKKKKACFFPLVEYHV